MVDGVVVQVTRRDHGFHHLFLQAVTHLLQTHTLVVLHRDHDGVDTQRHHGSSVLSVLNGHLDGEEEELRFQIITDVKSKQNLVVIKLFLQVMKINKNLHVLMGFTEPYLALVHQ